MAVTVGVSLLEVHRRLATLFNFGADGTKPNTGPRVEPTSTSIAQALHLHALGGDITVFRGGTEDKQNKKEVRL